MCLLREFYKEFSLSSSHAYITPQIKLLLNIHILQFTEIYTDVSSVKT